MKNAWKLSNKQTGHTRTSSLNLSWELHCDPISDNYTPDESTPWIC
ncbi:hypothetical protein OG439_24445 [Amycolatopsis sp. NBC_01307]|nr:hypothetical protein OG439_24445 [Amycolatopsis sp. NBC_01307]